MARSQKVQVPTRTADLQVYTGSGLLYGFSFRESAGTPAAASFVLRDGTSTSGDFLAVAEVASNSVSNAWFGPQGIPFSVGVYLDMSAGEIEGVLYIG